MDQFAQLRDRQDEFARRSAQLLFVLPQEPAYNRQWLRAQQHWPEDVPKFFEEAPGKRPWLRPRDVSADVNCPLLGDPSYTMSADYGVALQDFHGGGNW